MRPAAPVSNTKRGSDLPMRILVHLQGSCHTTRRRISHKLAKFGAIRAGAHKPHGGPVVVSAGLAADYWVSRARDSGDDRGGCNVNWQSSPGNSHAVERALVLEARIYCADPDRATPHNPPGSERPRTRYGRPVA